MKKLLSVFVWSLLALPSMADSKKSWTLSGDTSRVVDLDEVIVVSQPKEGVLLRQQPLSSSAFAAQDMQRLHVQSLSQLSAYVPSFAMPEYGSRLTSSMYIRGIGSRVNNSAVGVYYDNIPLISKAAYNSHFYAIDRVDVLRGPQGTLYGVNTEGGIVRIYSKNPMNYQGTDIHVGQGTGYSQQADVAHYHRLNDRLAVMAAGFYHAQRGFFKNQNLNEYADQMQEAGGKMRWVWTPCERLTFDLTSDYQYTNQNGFPYGTYDADRQWAAQPATTFMPGYKRQMVNTGLNISYRMPTFLLSSATSYQYLRDRMDMDIDYKVDDNLALLQRQKANAITEELTLRSLNEGRWNHTTGIFASRQWLRTDAAVTFGQGILRPISKAIEDAMRAAMGGRMEVFMDAEMAVPNVFHQPQTNLALFHESRVQLLDGLTATLGLRYEYNKVELDYNSLGYMALTGGTSRAVATNTLSSHIANQHSTSFHQLLPKVALTYQLDQQGSHLYAAVSKGFMAGGYNIQLFSDILQADLNDPVAQRQAQRGDVEIAHSADDYADIEEAISYKPEEDWNYEVGAHLNLLDGKLHADVSTFYTRLHNQQLSVMAPQYGFGRMTVNAGKSSSCGAELALRGQAVDNHLNWTATYSYTRATFQDYQETAADGTVTDYQDNRVPYVPEHMFSAAADYRFDMANCGVLRAITVGANVAGQGKTYWDDANTVAQDFYATLGAHVGMNLGMVNVDLWGRNLTDTRYCTFVLPYNDSYIGQRGNPFHAGVDVTIHF